MRFWLAILVVAIGVGRGQSTSSHSGWNFADTLQTAKTVVIADIVDGTVTDSGSTVKVGASLRVVRVLAGSAIEGSVVPVAWSFAPAPFDTPSAIASLPHSRALFFLQADQVLQASSMGGKFGGFFVELPTTPLPGDLFYAADAKLPVKLASEFANAIEELAIRKAADFGPQKTTRISPAAPPEFVRTRMQFHGLVDALTQLDAAASAAAMRHLSASPDVNLRLLGIFGRIRGNDVAAVDELERDLPRLSKAFDAGMASRYIMEFDWEHNREAAQAFGRMALAESTLNGLDNMYAMRVSRNSGVEVMPYLAAIMRSPDQGPRDMALMAACQTVRNSGKWWKDEMQAHCPTRTPIADRQEEQAMLRYWTDWWAQTRESIGKSTVLAEVALPGRYSRAQKGLEMVEMPPEVRWQSLLSMMHSSATHVHGPNGEILEGAAQSSNDPVSARLGEPDREVFQASVKEVFARLDAFEQKSSAAMNAARLQGVAPNHERMAALNNEREAIFKETLAGLEQKLSSQGWNDLQNFLKQMGGVSMRVATVKLELTAPDLRK